MVGRIDISKLKVPPEKHELDTARYFARRGCDVEFIPPSHIPEIHRPDIRMKGMEWEIKSPTGKSRNSIERNMKQAAKQSSNIIMDLRRVGVPENICIAQIKNRFQRHSNIKRLIVIRKDENLLEFTMSKRLFD